MGLPLLASFRAANLTPDPLSKKFTVMKISKMPIMARKKWIKTRITFPSMFQLYNNLTISYYFRNRDSVN